MDADKADQTDKHELIDNHRIEKEEPEPVCPCS